MSDMKITLSPTQRRLGLSIAALALATACGGSPARGTLTGHLYMVGGPPPGTARLVDGTVVAAGPSGRHSVTVASDGERFTMPLAVGTYTVTGTSPQDNDSRSQCAADMPAVIRRDQASTADVYCQIP